MKIRIILEVERKLTNDGEVSNSTPEQLAALISEDADFLNWLLEAPFSAKVEILS